MPVCMLALQRWLGSTALADGGGRRRGPMAVTDTAGALQLQGAPGSRGPGGGSEGRGSRRGREPAGMTGGDDRRRGPTA